MMLQFGNGGNATLYHVVWEGLCFPVTLAWQVLFRLLGVRGDQGMMFILPMYGSAVLYLAGLGFVLGVLAKGTSR